MKFTSKLKQTTRIISALLGISIAALLTTAAGAASLPSVSSGQLLIQLDADNPGSLTLDGNNRVSAWADQAVGESPAFGGSFNQAVTSLQPVWVPNAINGRAPAVRFTGTDVSTNYLRATQGYTTTTALTLFWVVQGAPGVTNPLGLFDSGPAVEKCVRFFPDNAIEVQSVPADPASRLALTLPLKPTVLTVTLTNGVGFLQWGVYFNGVLQTNFTGATTQTFQQWWGPVLGAINLGGNGSFNGDVGAFVAYQGVLSGNDQQGVMEALLEAYSVPEPSTVMMLGLGVLLVRRRFTRE